MIKAETLLKLVSVVISISIIASSFTYYFTENILALIIEGIFITALFIILFSTKKLVEY